VDARGTLGDDVRDGRAADALAARGEHPGEALVAQDPGPSGGGDDRGGRLARDDVDVDLAVQTGVVGDEALDAVEVVGVLRVQDVTARDRRPYVHQEPPTCVSLAVWLCYAAP